MGNKHPGRRERCIARLRQRALDGDVIAKGRLQETLGREALLAARRDEQKRPVIIDIRATGAPSHRRARRLSQFPRTVATANIPNLVILPSFHSVPEH